jgi:hypothetical protein
MDEPQPGDTFSVQMGWTLPDGHRIQATFKVQVEAFEPEKNRMRCRLLEIEAVVGSKPASEIDPEYLSRVGMLVGKRALIPTEALRGLVLPLRLATLTGEHPYFSG